MTVSTLLTSRNVQSSKRDERPRRVKVFFQPSSQMRRRLSGDKIGLRARSGAFEVPEETAD